MGRMNTPNNDILENYQDLDKAKPEPSEEDSNELVDIDEPSTLVPLIPIFPKFDASVTEALALVALAP